MPRGRGRSGRQSRRETAAAAAAEAAMDRAEESLSMELADLVLAKKTRDINPFAKPTAKLKKLAWSEVADAVNVEVGNVKRNERNSRERIQKLIKLFEDSDKDMITGTGGVELTPLEKVLEELIETEGMSDGKKLEEKRKAVETEAAVDAVRREALNRISARIPEQEDDLNTTSESVEQDIDRFQGESSREEDRTSLPSNPAKKICLGPKQTVRGRKQDPAMEYLGKKISLAEQDLDAKSKMQILEIDNQKEERELKRLMFLETQALEREKLDFEREKFKFEAKERAKKSEAEQKLQESLLKNQELIFGVLEKLAVKNSSS